MNRDKSIKFLGIFFIAVGAIELLSKATRIQWLTALFRPSSFMTVQDYLLYFVSTLFFFIILPMVILMAGIGIIKMRRWGWKLAVTVCTLTLIINLIGIVNFAFASYKSKGLAIPVIREGAHVGTISMWPTYISGIICAFLILLLTRKSIKERFI